MSAIIAVTASAAVFAVLHPLTSRQIDLTDRIAITVAAVVAAMGAVTIWLLRNLDRELPAATKHSTDLAWRAKPDGRLTVVDPRLATAFGYSTTEMTALALSDLVDGVEHERLWAHLQTGRGWTKALFRCRTRSGAPLWLETSAHTSHANLIGTATLIDYVPVRAESNRDARIAITDLIGRGGVQPAFQPIVCSLTGRLLGVEALSRFPTDESGRSPEDWFIDAARAGLGTELEIHAAHLALTAASDLPADIYISVNLSPAAIAWPGTSSALSECGIDFTRIIIELTEHQPVADYGALADSLAPLRRRGARVAVDDAGAGYASLRHIVKLEPDIIKIDRSIIAGIADRTASRAMTAAITTFANETGATVVGEGVETVDELAVLQNLGVIAAQGYLLAKPTVDSADWRSWEDPDWYSLFPDVTVPTNCRTCTADCRLAGHAPQNRVHTTAGLA